jgi:hypothetical protein
MVPVASAPNGQVAALKMADIVFTAPAVHFVVTFMTSFSRGR